jgi:hypothetical protein
VLEAGGNDHGVVGQNIWNQWPYKAYFSGLCKGISPQFIWTYVVLTYLHFRILKIPLMKYPIILGVYPTNFPVLMIVTLNPPCIDDTWMCIPRLGNVVYNPYIYNL